MTVINGVVIGGSVVPTDTGDTYPTHLPTYGKGGLRTEATLASRNLIPANRLEEGMIVYVLADTTYYVLKNGYHNPLVDGDWEAWADNSGNTFDAGTPDGAILQKTSANTEGQATAISETLITSSEVVATFTNTVGTQLMGSTLTALTLDWTYNRNADDPDSQTIDQGIGAIAVTLRTKALTAQTITTDITYTISAVGDDMNYGAIAGNPSSLTTTVPFLNHRYFGVDTVVLSTDTGVKADLTAEFVSSKVVAKTFDASVNGGSNYLYYCYPKRLGLPTSTTFNGFTFTDYTSSTITAFSNESAYAEDFYLLKTNNVYSGSSIAWNLL